jgi:predicted HicB family RNase H-like nuclease
MNNLLKHNNFLGSVSYSAEDDCFFGKIIGINDLITFEGDSVDTLKSAFREAVEDYLFLCEEAGKEPQKSYKGSFNVRISPDLHKDAVVMATQKGVSLNAFVEKAISDTVYA